MLPIVACTTLRVIHIGSILTAIDVGDAKPVGYADDGAQVAWSVYAVERQTQFAGINKSNLLMLPV